MKLRKIFASREMGEAAKKSPNKRIEVYSFFPVDKAGCECQALILKWKNKLPLLNETQKISLMGETQFLVCPRSKKGMMRYEVICNTCGDILGYCWATDNTLKDWCDFHYVSWTDGKVWRGCLTPHISPITQELCLECCCGEDTRDFRANMKLSEKIASMIEKRNAVGRKFGKKDSKFGVRKVGSSVLPFK